VEPLPSADIRKQILFFEASEGGAGVLSQIAGNDKAISDIAKKALEIMHYKPDLCNELTVKEIASTDADAPCETGCYHCLLSYQNQTDHQFINRKDPDTLRILIALINGTRKTSVKTSDSFNNQSSSFLHLLETLGYPSKEYKRKVLHNGTEIPLYNASRRLCLFFTAPEEKIISYLKEKVLLVIILGNNPDDWEEKIRHNKTIFAVGEKVE
jgi:hypothetical protein